MIVMSVEYFYIIAAMIVISILLASFSIMSIAYPQLELELKFQGQIVNNGTAIKVDFYQCLPYLLTNFSVSDQYFSQTKTYCHTF